MIDPNSRYYSLKTLTYTDAQGQETAYKARRFLPQDGHHVVLAEVVVQQSERLDVFTSRTLGNPLQYHHIADANLAMDPLDLIKEPGRMLRIPLPK